MNRATLLIPAHNRCDVTLGCLHHLATSGDLAACDVIVIDDGSTDGTGAAIRANFPSVTVIDGSGRLFWTGAIALAMTRLAAEPQRGPVVWLNDDCRPRADALATLIRWLETNPRGLAGPTCFDASGRRVPTGFVGREVFAASESEARPVDGLSGFCVGLGSVAWRELGPPDAQHFPHYAGDTAYTLRAHQHGHPVVLLGAAAVDLLDLVPNAVPVRDAVKTDESLLSNWRRILGATRSPFRVRTMAALLRLKYGVVLGTALATWRATAWTIEVALAWIRGRKATPRPAS
jgi:GT2 family glycosyltransferase